MGTSAEGASRLRDAGTSPEAAPACMTLSWRLTYLAPLAARAACAAQGPPQKGEARMRAHSLPEQTKSPQRPHLVV